MRLPCASSRAFRQVRAPLALLHRGQRHAVHTKQFDAAVIGGGITGLTAAYQLSRDPSCSKVTLYEKSSHLGGWLSSEQIPVPGGHVVFEYGPRTLRTSSPSCLPMMDLIMNLDLLDEVLICDKKSPAAQNRYIYYPDHLVRLPFPPTEGLLKTAWTLLMEPLFETFLYSAIFEKPKRAENTHILSRDESVADFVSRRFSPKMSENLASAVMAGIFAGDVNRLSAEMAIGYVRELEKRYGSIVDGMMTQRASEMRAMPMDELLALESVAVPSHSDDRYWKSLRAVVSDASVLTLKNGLGQLTDAMAAQLRSSRNVEVVTGTEVTSLGQNPKTQDLTIGFGKNESKTHNRVIATHAPSSLARQIQNTKVGVVPSDTIRDLGQNNYAVTVMVVNLYYEDPDLVPVEGFGYLLPSSVPFEQNPERALGVIFGSQSSEGQDTAPGTKLTVMMGGHLWDGWSESDYPDPDKAIEMAQALLHRHLGIKTAPSVARARLLRDAIPQYTVGHLSRMKELSHSVRSDFHKRLTLAGAWYGTVGIGVVDCIRQGYLASSYGVGSKKLGPGNSRRPWTKHDFHNWELEGGIATSPVRFDNVHVTERQHY
ncbi:protoporphyrinogen oxidase [Aspergillus costaricaensis CBS 115574]|uniref:Protoporphyrinogen oxidase n=1 Tax=Aspergillus costaricaensis CBS 115574 TaxID=1448317 RepID=A0ACD1I7P0_9EURO|nr:protoporphyrinogen oxidase [Aspergillus costaricaensis CBS 115574]RAK86243.1 protoporphyrinogen oxidase [Aspergillus costaricaensis CBS 115574]